jgi:hypothetical protein
MKKIKPTKDQLTKTTKLAFTTETIRQLAEHDLARVAGAGPFTGSRCWCP